MNFENVYFITGTAYAGKSTMVKLLAQKFDGIACEENYHDVLLPELDAKEFPCVTYTRDLQDWHEFIRRSPQEYKDWIDGAARECEILELRILEDMLKNPETQNKKIFVDTNISIETLHKIAKHDHVLIMLAAPDISVRRFFERPDKEKQFLYQLIMEEPDPQAALQNYRKGLELINSQENYDRLLNSGFNVILRDEKLGVQGTLELVSKKFGLSDMFHIYQNYSDLYDELVNHEDYNNNLNKFLRDNIQWENKVVGEFGIGTGRVTRNYIDKAQKLYAYDNSEHMIDKAKVNLSKWADKIEYSILDNSKINSVEQSFDIIIEGWSFGHLVVQDDENRNQTIQTLISESTKRAKEVIFIETLGTNVDAPNPPGEKLAQFYKALVKAGFKEHVIETDYKFDNPEEAAKTMGAFFGDSMKNDIIQKQLNVIKEYTGIWIYMEA